MRNFTRSTSSYLLRAKTSELAALTRKGFWAPPAPSAFMAFHRPGATKPTAPMTQALKKVVRYHFRGSPRAGASTVVTTDILLSWPRKAPRGRSQALCQTRPATTYCTCTTYLYSNRSRCACFVKFLSTSFLNAIANSWRLSV